MARIFVGLGSNVGDRLLYLQQALKLLNAVPVLRLVACSSVYETEPVGNKAQPVFLNAVVEFQSDVPPQELLRAAKGIERQLGRTETEHWGPREIDIDVLYYGDVVVKDDDLCLPHPEAANRRFVLIPLKEIAASFIDPLRKRTIDDLLHCCSDTSAVRKSSKLVHQQMEN
jgi:2-amino-4-hydroxy-6-hydroxymethyldihydropteridine diphosphokinase